MATPITIDRSRRAVIYLRVASRHKPDWAAAGHQRDACQRIANKHGLAVVREYVDLGRPARLKEQVELQQLLHDLATKHDAAHVIVWGYPVLARDLGQLDDIIAELAGYKAEVLTITGVETVQRDASDDVIDTVLDSDPQRREIQKLIDPSEEECQ